MTAEHAPPVPPRELRAQWINDCPILSPGATGGPMLRIGTDWTGVSNKAAAWGWEQAIPEREELAGLLMEADSVIECHVDHHDPDYAVRQLLRAAAERLRGGGE